MALAHDVKRIQNILSATGYGLSEFPSLFGLVVKAQEQGEEHQPSLVTQAFDLAGQENHDDPVYDLLHDLAQYTTKLEKVINILMGY